MQLLFHALCHRSRDSHGRDRGVKGPDKTSLRYPLPQLPAYGVRHSRTAGARLPGVQKADGGQGMTIRAVYFDLGGVIVRTEFESPRERLAERLGLTYEELVKIVFESKSSREASIGKISEDDHWKWVTRAVHRPLKDRETLHKEFFDGDII